jgi:hypothetical protein
LDALGQFQFLIDLFIGLLEALVDAVDFGGLLIKSVVNVLDAQQGASLGEQFLRVERAEKVGVGAGFVAGPANGGAVTVGDVKDGSKDVFKPIAKTSAQIEGFVRRTASVHNEKLKPI